MVSAIGEIGTGAIIAFESAPTAYFGKILNIEWGGISRPAVDISNFATTTARVFIPGDVYDPGELAVDMLCDPNQIPPIGKAAERITLTFPGGTPNTWYAEGFMTSFSMTLPLEDKIVANATIKFTDAITLT